MASNVRGLLQWWAGRRPCRETLLYELIPEQVLEGAVL